MKKQMTVSQLIYNLRLLNPDAEVHIVEEVKFGEVQKTKPLQSTRELSLISDGQEKTFVLLAK